MARFPTEAHKFGGLIPKQRPDILFPSLRLDHANQGEWIHCPKCEGYGGWYSSRYGKLACNQCNSWGWVESLGPNAVCIHAVRELSQAECRTLGYEHWGNCYHVYRCENCGHVYGEDSSG